ncbi:hypothetical protein [Mycobacterium sp. 1482292.6]|uniref:hypothetical protein n=1 Tax=Mycobacterium sp. 1482292.6 TaxID=1834081 RepID=UPI0012EA45B0|nr:hypothetical protein [Mycobacterium sp. 1482292.6]
MNNNSQQTKPVDPRTVVKGDHVRLERTKTPVTVIDTGRTHKQRGRAGKPNVYGTPSITPAGGTQPEEYVVLHLDNGETVELPVADTIDLVEE